MRKLLAMVLALMLSLGCMPALGEGVEFETYTQPILGYTIEHPAHWLAMDSENLVSLTESLLDGNEMEGIDPSVYADLESQIAGTNMTMFLELNGNNVNIVMQDLGLALTNDLFLAMVMPSMITQFQGMFADIQFMDEGSIYAAGENEYIRMEAVYVLNGQNVHIQQYYYLQGTAMYVLNATFAPNLSDESLAAVVDCVDHMLATFTPAVAE